MTLAASQFALANTNDALAGDDATEPATRLPQECMDSAAVSYLKLIEAMDWQGMRKRLASDARYVDPTMVHYNRPAIDRTGADAVVAFWRTSSEESGTTLIKYAYRNCFETAGFHVVHYDIAVDVSGEYWGINQKQVTIPGQVMSVIRIVDGLVAEHRDYVDYAGADRHVESLQGNNQR